MKKRNFKRSDFIIKLGKQIAHIRDDKKLTQDDIAEKVKITIPTLSKIENGTTDSKMSTIEKVAEAMGIRPGEIFIEAESISLELPILLQEIITLLRYEDNETLDAVKQQVQILLKIKNKK